MEIVDHAISPNAPDLKAALEAADLPADDLGEAGRTFFRYDVDGKPVGYGGYERYGDAALLRSIVVLPELRGQGLGKAIAENVASRAFNDGARHAYLLTTSAASFFESLGYALIERSSAPQEILNTKQAATLCPSTAAMLSRQLNG